MYGIRYIVVALGGPDDPARDEDCEALKEFMEGAADPFPLTFTALSERVSNKVTLALLQEKGVL